jgi:hypothetical protein
MKTILAAMFCATCFAQTVTIVNSGSTNSPGFQIAIGKSGKAVYTARRGPAGPVEKTVPKQLAERLYKDVKAAEPLASLPPQSCMKSASFGTRLTVQSGDDVSPDLSCGDDGSARMQALIRDVNDVVKVFPAPPIGR